MMEHLMNFMGSWHGPVALVLALWFISGVVVNWKHITRWIGMIQPPEWMNTLAMVIALGVIPLFYVYGRWIVAAIVVMVVIFTL